jgi:hypothetical protein
VSVEKGWVQGRQMLVLCSPSAGSATKQSRQWRWMALVCNSQRHGRAAVIDILDKLREMNQEQAGVWMEGRSEEE